MDLEAYESCGPNITWKLVASLCYNLQTVQTHNPDTRKIVVEYVGVGTYPCVLSVLYRMANEKFRYERIVDV